MGPEREEELWKSAEIRNLSSCQNHSEWGIFEDKNDLFAKNIDIFPVISNLNPVHLWLSAKNQHRIPQDPKLYDSNFLLRLFYNLLQPGSEVVLFSFVIFVYLFFFHLSSENLKIFVYLIFFYFWKKNPVSGELRIVRQNELSGVRLHVLLLSPLDHARPRVLLPPTLSRAHHHIAG